MKPWHRTLMIVAAVVLILGVPVYVTVQNWSSTAGNFFSYTFVDLYGIFVTVLIGTGITLFFTNRISNSSMRMGIIGANIDSLQEVQAAIIDKVKESGGKRLSRNDKLILVRLFRIASIETTNVHKYLKECCRTNKAIDEIIGSLKSDLLDFKSIVTDEPFQGSNVLSVNTGDRAINQYYDLKFNLQKLKLLLYS
jgi:hypothetical protein